MSDLDRIICERICSNLLHL